MDILITAGNWLVDNIRIILEVIGVAALIATKTPNKSDDKFIQLLLDGVNFIGMNLGKARTDPTIN
jgi:hypothetical protein